MGYARRLLASRVGEAHLTRFTSLRTWRVSQALSGCSVLVTVAERRPSPHYAVDGMRASRSCMSFSSFAAV